MSLGDTSMHSGTIGTEEQLRAGLGRVQMLALVIGLVGLGACGGVMVANPALHETFYRSYLFAYAFWLGLALGSGAIAMIHNLSGGRWGQAARRVIEAANACLSVLAVLGLPLLWAVYRGHIYPWAGQDKSLHLLPHKAWLLQREHVIVIAIIAYAVWSITAVMLRIGAKRVEATRSFAVLSVFAGMSAFGLIFYTLTMTIVAVTWVMSLTPNWYSTMFTLIFIMGQVLSAFAFAVIVNALMQRYEPVHGRITIDQFNDLASFMLAFTILWAYMSFSQVIITWMGHLKQEEAWYAHRNHGAWLIVGLSLMVLQFTAPFLLLLVRAIKRSPAVLTWVALGIIVMRFVDVLYLIKPSFPVGEQVSWMDAVLLIGIGGIFIFTFILILKRHKLEPPPLVSEYSAMELGHPELLGATEYGAAISHRKGPVP